MLYLPRLEPLAGAYVVDGECTVCFDALIDTGLHPCGHFALCRGCADRLDPRLCPICRAPIQRYRAPPARRVASRPEDLKLNKMDIQGLNAFKRDQCPSMGHAAGWSPNRFNREQPLRK